MKIRVFIVGQTKAPFNMEIMRTIFKQPFDRQPWNVVRTSLIESFTVYEYCNEISRRNTPSRDSGVWTGSYRACNRLKYVHQQFAVKQSVNRRNDHPDWSIMPSQRARTICLNTWVDWGGRDRLVSAAGARGSAAVDPAFVDVAAFGVTWLSSPMPSLGGAPVVVVVATGIAIGCSPAMTSTRLAISYRPMSRNAILSASGWPPSSSLQTLNMT